MGLLNATMYWKEAGISYLKYATLSARALRKVLKEDVKAVAMKREEYNVKMAKWTDGVPGEPIMLAEKSRL